LTSTAPFRSYKVPNFVSVTVALPASGIVFSPFQIKKPEHPKHIALDIRAFISPVFPVNPVAEKLPVYFINSFGLYYKIYFQIKP
jgi:hypothetical protein